MLRLSDSFPKIPNGECALECTAVVLNINYGHNKEIMEGCRKLYEYSFFVEEIRKGLIQGLTLEGAVSGAMDTCVHSNILEPFLRRHRAEVHALILEEYDEELHIRNEKELSYQEGHTAGVSFGLKEGLMELLNHFEPLPETLISRIQSEQDPDVLRSWLKLAASAGSCEEFIKEIIK
ncbi:MAG: hypothetical protein SPF60_05425 [Lachnospiraceae bacterium]|nr:hypothetical protein [Lachnospiraceae bacterium]